MLKERRTRLRWKLLIITSLLAAVVGASATLGLALGLTGSAGRPTGLDLYVLLMLVAPAATIFFASFFVYRHTARWRKAQALSTALLSILLTLTILVAASMLTARAPSEQGPPAPPMRNTT
jgi:amino acid transporter